MSDIFNQSIVIKNKWTKIKQKLLSFANNHKLFFFKFFKVKFSLICLSTFCCSIVGGWGSLSWLVKSLQVRVGVPLRFIRQDCSKASTLSLDCSLLLLFKDVLWQVWIFIQLFIETGFSFFEQLILVVNLILLNK